MKKATAVIFQDTYHPKKDGTCAVNVKITFNRRRKYYPTGIYLLPLDYSKVMNGKRRLSSEKELHVKINFFLSKAQEVIESLNVFTFDNFEEGYFEQRNISNSVSFAFDKYTNQLKDEKRIGTATSYNSAKNSLESFKKDLTFADISVSFLKKYQTWMIENGKSVTTIGIYLRSLRAVYNLQNIDAKTYPFGQNKTKFSIPKGRNTKKALTLEEVAKIYNYKTTEGTTKDMAKDYWLFLYLCNGMNVKDFCLLTWGDIDDNMISYQRAKTIRSQKEQKRISVALKPETWAIIKKWGQPSILKNAYIFPHLNTNMTPERERAVYQQLTKTMNKYTKQIGSELGINKKLTSYVARHSFATVLKRSGTQTEMISELLGHSSKEVTENYLDSFETDQIQEQTDVLTTGFKTSGQ